MADDAVWQAGTEDPFPDALRPGTVLGDYQIVKVIGQGGFGITYEGMHRFLGRRVAIKEFFVKQACRRQPDGAVTLTSAAESDGLTREDYARLLTRFEREARKVSAKFDHPGIVQGEAYFVANGVGYFVMRFVPGVTLDHWLRRLGRPPDEHEIAAVLWPVMLAVDYLHEADELHRDLTPKNIMLRPDGHPVIIDFGASREGLDRSSQTSMALATDGYAPPEQCLALDDAQQGRYTDIYALGAILYRAASGRAPLSATDRANALARKRASTDPYVPLASAAPEPWLYSDRFLAAVDRALQLDEDDRPQRIDEFLQDLGWWATATTAPPTPQTGSPPADLPIEPSASTTVAAAPSARALHQAASWPAADPSGLPPPLPGPAGVPPPEAARPFGARLLSLVLVYLLAFALIVLAGTVVLSGIYFGARGLARLG
jgi:serine/threonine protein kinase